MDNPAAPATAINIEQLLHLHALTKDVSKVVIVPHGPSTHDHNPATTTEALKIAATARAILETAKPVPGGSRSCWPSRR